MTEVPLNLPIDEKELNLVDGFRQSRNTSVLTIMFTDIQGFTKLTEERGDAFSNEMRRAHDGILVPVIEQDGAGRVIKHIGDAVMAVFSEPSTAVARALEIQDGLRKYNAAHPGPAAAAGSHRAAHGPGDGGRQDEHGRLRPPREPGLAGGRVGRGRPCLPDLQRVRLGQGLAGGTERGSGLGFPRALPGERASTNPWRFTRSSVPALSNRKRPRAPKSKRICPASCPAAGLVLAGALAVTGVPGLREDHRNLRGPGRAHRHDGRLIGKQDPASV